jgi:hypothetical protein
VFNLVKFLTALAKAAAPSSEIYKPKIKKY